MPNVDDAFPIDATRFAGFESFVDPAVNTLFSVAVAASDTTSPVTVVGQSDLGTPNLSAQRWSLDPALLDPQLTTETLAPLAGNYSAAYGVNASGLTVGESSSGPNFVPVYWAAGSTAAVALSRTITEGVGEAQTVTTFAAGAAYGVNDGGQIVGEVERADGSLMAVLWQPVAGVYGEPLALPELTTGMSATAHFIGADGMVVGEAMTAAGLRATLWQVDAAGVVQGSALNLGTFDPSHVASSAYGVDNLGRVVGESVASTGTIRGAIWTLSGATVASVVELGAGSSAMAISGDTDRIAGFATTGAEQRAAVWDSRSTVPANFDAVLSSGPALFTPTAGESRAFGMSPDGVVVGLSLNKAFVAIPQ
ncbi:MAG: hypothetical protein ACYDAI_15245 [Trichloromonadaceae bacterium]